jgi:anti-sigma B factor antagonist
MAIKETIKEDVAILTISGKLMGGPETQQVHEHIKSLIAEGIKKVVIDLGKVKWLNSAGLGVFIASLTSLKKVGGNLKLANATRKVQSLFMITQLITIFENYKTVDRAVASFLGKGKK